MKTLRNIILGFLRFGYDFIIGDCWQLALGAALVLVAGVLLVRTEAINQAALPVLVALAMMALVVLTVAWEWRRQATRPPKKPD